MRIGLDIDDVLFPWTEHAHAAAEAAGITNGAQVTQWAFHNDYGCTRDEWWAVINEAYVAGMLERDPYPGVVELLGEVHQNGHSIHLVTARGFEGGLADLVRTTTAAWSRRLPHDSLTFSKDKTVLRCDQFLDDSVSNVESLHRAGVPACLRTQPHNARSATQFTFHRVADLAEFLVKIGAVG
jgi:hypothetical protein